MDEPPGFRLLALLPNGDIRSEVVRIDEMPHGLERVCGILNPRRDLPFAMPGRVAPSSL